MTSAGRSLFAIVRPMLYRHSESAPRSYAAALRRAFGLRVLRGFAVDLRRALPERFVAVFFTAGLAAFFFAVFAMSSISLCLQFVFLPNTKRQYLNGTR